MANVFDRLVSKTSHDDGCDMFSDVGNSQNGDNFEGLAHVERTDKASKTDVVLSACLKKKGTSPSLNRAPVSNSALTRLTTSGPSPSYSSTQSLKTMPTSSINFEGTVNIIKSSIKKSKIKKTNAPVQSKSVTTGSRSTKPHSADGSDVEVVSVKKNSNSNRLESLKKRQPSYAPLKKPFVIPRKQKNDEQILQEVQLDSREYSREIHPILTRHHRDQMSKNKFSYETAYIVNNEQLLKEFLEKKREMKEEGRNEKEVADSYGFYYCANLATAKEIATKGLTVTSSFVKCLGSPTMGVYVSRFSDMIRPAPFVPNAHKHFMVVFRTMKGKVKSIQESYSDNILEPTPNYDCHISKNAKQQTGFDLNQIYFYEYGEEDMVARPRHVCPFAVIKFTVKMLHKINSNKANSSSTVNDAGPSARFPSASSDNANVKGQSVTKTGLIGDGATPSEQPDSVMNPGYTIWTGKLTNRKHPICTIELVSKKSPITPFKLPHYLDLTMKMPIESLKLRLTEKIFNISTQPRNLQEVLVNDRYYISCVCKAGYDDKARMANLIAYLQKHKIASVVKLQEKRELYFYTSEKEPASGVLYCLFSSESPMVSPLKDCGIKDDSSEPDPVPHARKLPDSKPCLFKVFKDQCDHIEEMRAKKEKLKKLLDQIHTSAERKFGFHVPAQPTQTAPSRRDPRLSANSQASSKSTSPSEPPMNNAPSRRTSPPDNAFHISPQLSPLDSSPSLSPKFQAMPSFTPPPPDTSEYGTFGSGWTAQESEPEREDVKNVTDEVIQTQERQLKELQEQLNALRKAREEMENSNCVPLQVQAIPQKNVEQQQIKDGQKPKPLLLSMTSQQTVNETVLSEGNPTTPVKSSPPVHDDDILSPASPEPTLENIGFLAINASNTCALDRNMLEKVKLSENVFIKLKEIRDECPLKAADAATGLSSRKRSVSQSSFHGDATGGDLTVDGVFGAGSFSVVGTGATNDFFTTAGAVCKSDTVAASYFAASQKEFTNSFLDGSWSSKSKMGDGQTLMELLPLSMTSQYTMDETVLSEGSQSTETIPSLPSSFPNRDSFDHSKYVAASHTTDTSDNSQTRASAADSAFPSESNAPSNMTAMPTSTSDMILPKPECSPNESLKNTSAAASDIINKLENCVSLPNLIVSYPLSKLDEVRNTVTADVEVSLKEMKRSRNTTRGPEHSSKKIKTVHTSTKVGNASKGKFATISRRSSSTKELKLHIIADTEGKKPSGCKRKRNLSENDVQKRCLNTKLQNQCEEYSQLRSFTKDQEKHNQVNTVKEDNTRMILTKMSKGQTFDSSKDLSTSGVVKGKSTLADYDSELISAASDMKAYLNTASNLPEHHQSEVEQMKEFLNSHIKTESDNGRQKSKSKPALLSNVGKLQGNSIPNILSKATNDTMLPGNSSPSPGQCRSKKRRHHSAPYERESKYNSRRTKVNTLNRSKSHLEYEEKISQKKTRLDEEVGQKEKILITSNNFCQNSNGLKRDVVENCSTSNKSEQLGQKSTDLLDRQLGNEKPTKLSPQSFQKSSRLEGDVDKVNQEAKRQRRNSRKQSNERKRRSSMEGRQLSSESNSSSLQNVHKPKWIPVSEAKVKQKLGQESTDLQDGQIGNEKPTKLSHQTNQSQCRKQKRIPVTETKVKQQLGQENTDLQDRQSGNEKPTTLSHQTNQSQCVKQKWTPMSEAKAKQQLEQENTDLQDGQLGNEKPTKLSLQTNQSQCHKQKWIPVTEAKVKQQLGQENTDLQDRQLGNEKPTKLSHQTNQSVKQQQLGQENTDLQDGQLGNEKPTKLSHQTNQSQCHKQKGIPISETKEKQQQQLEQKSTDLQDGQLGNEKPTKLSPQSEKSSRLEDDVDKVNLNQQAKWQRRNSRKQSNERKSMSSGEGRQLSSESTSSSLQNVHKPKWIPVSEAKVKQQQLEQENTDLQDRQLGNEKSTKLSCQTNQSQCHKQKWIPLSEAKAKQQLGQKNTDLQDGQLGNEKSTELSHQTKQSPCHKQKWIPVTEAKVKQQLGQESTDLQDGQLGNEKSINLSHQTNQSQCHKQKWIPITEAKVKQQLGQKSTDLQDGQIGNEKSTELSHQTNQSQCHKQKWIPISEGKANRLGQENTDLQDEQIGNEKSTKLSHQTNQSQCHKQKWIPITEAKVKQQLGQKSTDLQDGQIGNEKSTELSHQTNQSQCHKQKWIPITEAKEKQQLKQESTDLQDGQLGNEKPTELSHQTNQSQCHKQKGIPISEAKEKQQQQLEQKSTDLKDGQLGNEKPTKLSHQTNQSQCHKQKWIPVTETKVKSNLKEKKDEKRSASTTGSDAVKNSSEEKNILHSYSKLYTLNNPRQHKFGGSNGRSSSSDGESTRSGMKPLHRARENVTVTRKGKDDLTVHVTCGKDRTNWWEGVTSKEQLLTKCVLYSIHKDRNRSLKSSDLSPTLIQGILTTVHHKKVRSTRNKVNTSKKVVEVCSAAENPEHRNYLSDMDDDNLFEEEEKIGNKRTFETGSFREKCKQLYKLYSYEIPPVTEKKNAQSTTHNEVKLKQEPKDEDITLNNRTIDAIKKEGIQLTEERDPKPFLNQKDSVDKDSCRLSCTSSERKVCVVKEENHDTSSKPACFPQRSKLIKLNLTKSSSIFRSKEKPTNTTLPEAKVSSRKVEVVPEGAPIPVIGAPTVKLEGTSSKPEGKQIQSRISNRFHPFNRSKEPANIHNLKVPEIQTLPVATSHPCSNDRPEQQAHPDGCTDKYKPPALPEFNKQATFVDGVGKQTFGESGKHVVDALKKLNTLDQTQSSAEINAARCIQQVTTVMSGLTHSKSFISQSHSHSSNLQDTGNKKYDGSSLEDNIQEQMNRCALDLQAVTRVNVPSSNVSSTTKLESAIQEHADLFDNVAVRPELQRIEVTINNTQQWGLNTEIKERYIVMVQEHSRAGVEQSVMMISNRNDNIEMNEISEEAVDLQNSYSKNDIKTKDRKDGYADDIQINDKKKEAILQTSCSESDHKRKDKSSDDIQINTIKNEANSESSCSKNDQKRKAKNNDIQMNVIKKEANSESSCSKNDQKRKDENNDIQINTIKNEANSESSCSKNDQKRKDENNDIQMNVIKKEANSASSCSKNDQKRKDENNDIQINTIKNEANSASSCSKNDQKRKVKNNDIQINAEKKEANSASSCSKKDQKRKVKNNDIQINVIKKEANSASSCSKNDQKRKDENNDIQINAKKKEANSASSCSKNDQKRKDENNDIQINVIKKEANSESSCSKNDLKRKAKNNDIQINAKKKEANSASSCSKNDQKRKDENNDIQINVINKEANSESSCSKNDQKRKDENNDIQINVIKKEANSESSCSKNDLKRKAKNNDIQINAKKKEAYQKRSCKNDSKIKTKNNDIQICTKKKEANSVSSCIKNDQKRKAKNNDGIQSIVMKKEANSESSCSKNDQKRNAKNNDIQINVKKKEANSESSCSKNDHKRKAKNNDGIRSIVMKKEASSESSCSKNDHKRKAKNNDGIRSIVIKKEANSESSCSKNNHKSKDRSSDRIQINDRNKEGNSQSRYKTHHKRKDRNSDRIQFSDVKNEKKLHTGDNKNDHKRTDRKGRYSDENYVYCHKNNNERKSNGCTDSDIDSNHDYKRRTSVKSRMRYGSDRTDGAKSHRIKTFLTYRKHTYRPTRKVSRRFSTPLYIPRKRFRIRNEYMPGHDGQDHMENPNNQQSMPMYDNQQHIGETPSNQQCMAIHGNQQHTGGIPSNQLCMPVHGNQQHMGGAPSNQQCMQIPGNQQHIGGAPNNQQCIPIYGNQQHMGGTPSNQQCMPMLGNQQYMGGTPNNQKCMAIHDNQQHIEGPPSNQQCMQVHGNQQHMEGPSNQQCMSIHGNQQHMGGVPNNQQYMPIHGNQQHMGGAPNNQQCMPILGNQQHMGGTPNNQQCMPIHGNQQHMETPNNQQCMSMHGNQQHRGGTPNNQQCMPMHGNQQHMEGAPNNQQCMPMHGNQQHMEGHPSNQQSMPMHNNQQHMETHRNQQDNQQHMNTLSNQQCMPVHLNQQQIEGRPSNQQNMPMHSNQQHMGTPHNLQGNQQHMNTHSNQKCMPEHSKQQHMSTPKSVKSRMRYGSDRTDRAKSLRKRTYQKHIIYTRKYNRRFSTSLYKPRKRIRIRKQYMPVHDSQDHLENPSNQQCMPIHDNDNQQHMGGTPSNQQCMPIHGNQQHKEGNPSEQQCMPMHGNQQHIGGTHSNQQCMPIHGNQQHMGGANNQQCMPMHSNQQQTGEIHSNQQCMPIHGNQQHMGGTSNQQCMTIHGNQQHMEGAPSNQQCMPIHSNHQHTGGIHSNQQCMPIHDNQQHMEGPLSNQQHMGTSRNHQGNQQHMNTPSNQQCMPIHGSRQHMNNPSNQQCMPEDSNRQYMGTPSNQQCTPVNHQRIEMLRNQQRMEIISNQQAMGMHSNNQHDGMLSNQQNMAMQSSNEHGGMLSNQQNMQHNQHNIRMHGDNQRGGMFNNQQNTGMHCNNEHGGLLSNQQNMQHTQHNIRMHGDNQRGGMFNNQQNTGMHGSNEHGGLLSNQQNMQHNQQDMWILGNNQHDGKLNNQQTMQHSQHNMHSNNQHGGMQHNMQSSQHNMGMHNNSQHGGMLFNQQNTQHNQHNMGMHGNNQNDEVLRNQQNVQCIQHNMGIHINRQHGGTHDVILSNQQNTQHSQHRSNNQYVGIRNTHQNIQCNSHNMALHRNNQNGEMHNNHQHIQCNQHNMGMHSNNQNGGTLNNQQNMQCSQMDMHGNGQHGGMHSNQQDMQCNEHNMGLRSNNQNGGMLNNQQNMQHSQHNMDMHSNNQHGGMLGNQHEFGMPSNQQQMEMFSSQQFEMRNNHRHI